MPGRFWTLEHGPDTVEVSTAVSGGQLLQPDTDNVGKVEPAGAGSVTVLGVATDDAAPRGTAAAANFAAPRPETGVMYTPMDARVTYAANASRGQLLVAAANGQVTPYTAGTSTFDAVVGKCTEPAGVTAGNTGRMRLLV